MPDLPAKAWRMSLPRLSQTRLTHDRSHSVEQTEGVDAGNPDAVAVVAAVVADAVAALTWLSPELRGAGRPRQLPAHVAREQRPE